MRSFFRLFLVRWLLVLMVLPGVCQAQALPSRMQQAVSSLISDKAIKRGFAANDPRIAATLQTAGSTVAGAATAAAVVTLAGITAPAWVTAAVTVGLGALFAVGIDLAIDGIKWLLKSDGSVSLTVPMSSNTGPSPLVAGGAHWRISGDYVGIGSSLLLAFSASLNDSLHSSRIKCDMFSASSASCFVESYSPDGVPQWGYAGTANYSSSGSPCSSTTGACRLDVPYTPPSLHVPPPPPPQTMTSNFSNPSQAINTLSPAQIAKPANPQLVAVIADAAWKEASMKPGYDGLPYSVSDPITANDARTWQQANPDSWPTVGDLVNPQPTPATGPSPFSLPVPSSPPVTDPAPTPDPGTGTGETPTETKINWGTFTPPVLEDTPTIGSIIDPLLNLWPEWSSFSFPAHESACPTPSFKLPDGVVGGHTVHFTQMCDFLEANHVRQAMQAAFAVAWAILIAFIVMGA